MRRFVFYQSDLQWADVRAKKKQNDRHGRKPSMGTKVGALFYGDWNMRRPRAYTITFRQAAKSFFRRSHICGIGLLELLLRLLVCLDWVSPPSFYASVSVGMGHDIFTNMVFLAMRIAKVVDASFQTFGQQSVADPRSIFHQKKRVCLKSRTTSRFGFKCRHTRGDRGGTVVALLRPASVFQFARSRCALVVR